MSPNFDLTKAWNRKIRNVLWFYVLNNRSISARNHNWNAEST